MSWATCYSGSNNLHFESPPLMSDGRHFTKFDPSCESNDVLKKKLDLKSNYEYRQYLINNGDSLIINNRESCFNLNKNNKINGSQAVNNKYLFNGVNDKTKPFGYEGSDLKNLYLTRQQLESKFHSTVIKFN
jgi:hypothetical protein|tara:strand:+ start:559 stop:954 length:396 start_codon:yes stop_codon:yes gene_type:complete